MAEKQKILIVDDDANIAELISLYLLKECFDTLIVNDGEEAIEKFHSYQPGLILLDLMLPGIDGYEVCREIRKTSNVPIIMLSAKGEIFDKVLGLELGADDYMIKPFDSKELVARVKAVLRRFHPVVATAPQTVSSAIPPTGDYVEYPDLLINLSNYSVTYYNNTIDMPPKELELFYFLASHQIRYLLENSYLTISGDMNTSEILVLLMCILSDFERRSKIIQAGALPLSGVLAINSR